MISLSRLEPLQGIYAKPDKDSLLLTANILPFFAMNDNLRIFFSAGLGITSEKKDADGNEIKIPGTDEKMYPTVVAWHINPYVEIGQEWGPKFLAGIRLWSDGVKGGSLDGDTALVNWAVPVALIVSF